MNALLQDSLIIVGIGAVTYFLSKKFPHFFYTLTPPKSPPSTKMIWGVILGWFLVHLLLTFGLPNHNAQINMAASVKANLLRNWIPLGGLVVNRLVDIAFIVFCFKKLNYRFKDLGLIIGDIRRIVLWTILISANVFITYWYAFHSFIPNIGWSTLNPAIKVEFWINLVLIVILGPLFEELIFRGMFFSLLRSRYSVYLAWIGQAVLFGLAHGLQQNPIPAIGPGLIWGLGVLGSGSLLPGFISHMLYNLSGLITSLIR